MHGFTRGLERRLRLLEQRLGADTAPETAAETARRLTLCRAALAGEIPEDFREDERPVFSKILRDVPVFQELLDEGLVGDDLHRDDHPDLHDDDDDDLHPDLRHDDGDDFGELTWQP